MEKVAAVQYQHWQRLLFWLSWLLLLIPGYFIWYGFAMIGNLVLHGYTETIDLVLLMIMGTSLLELLLVAIYTLTHFWNQSTPFSGLLWWLMLGMAGIPLAATLGSIFSYAKLALHY